MQQLVIVLPPNLCSSQNEAKHSNFETHSKHATVFIICRAIKPDDNVTKLTYKVPSGPPAIFHRAHLELIICSGYLAASQPPTRIYCGTTSKDDDVRRRHASLPEEITLAVVKRSRFVHEPRLNTYF